MNMMRWTGLLIMLAVAAEECGCKQQCFLTECDYCHYRELGLPDLERDPGAAVTTAPARTPPPTTVLDLDRPIRYLSLSEAVAVALEHGIVGSQNLDTAGQADDNQLAFAGRGTGSDGIRVLALDPAIAGADIEASLSKFDARWITSTTWTSIDRPVATAADVAQAGSLNTIVAEDAAFRTSLIKPLPTGGVAGITFRTDYELTNLDARVNPAYQPALEFHFEQPLLQGFGVEANQLRASHPGSLLTPFATGGRVEGILITRLRFDLQRAEFERVVAQMLLNVEAAYWNLYGSYWTRYSREQGLRQAYEAWHINSNLHKAGRLSIADFAQTRGQYELFHERRLAALGQVLESEKQLRALMGLPVEDGCRLVPGDPPTLTPYQPEWSAALDQALALRPELIRAREAVKLRLLELTNQKNQLLPDLRFLSTYDLNGIGTRLDGPGPESALQSLASNHFHNWSLGLRLDVPIGFRDAHAAVRVAQLNLARSYLDLHDFEDKAQRQLTLEYRHLIEFHQRMRALQAQRVAYGQQLQARFEEYQVGRGSLDILLEAQRFWSQALADEFTLVAQYNGALAAFEFAKGTILDHDHVVIGEGPLPRCAAVRAVENERERSRAIELRERAQAVVHPPCDYEKGSLGLPMLPGRSAPSLPALFQGAPKTSDLPEQLPVPQPLRPEERGPD